MKGLQNLIIPKLISLLSRVHAEFLLAWDLVLSEKGMINRAASQQLYMFQLNFHLLHFGQFNDFPFVFEKIFGVLH